MTIYYNLDIKNPHKIVVENRKPVELLKEYNEVDNEISEIVKKFSGHGLEKNHFLKLLNKILKNFLKINYVEIEGRKMILDSNFSYLSFGGSYEPMVTDLVKREIKESINKINRVEWRKENEDQRFTN